MSNDTRETMNKQQRYHEKYLQKVDGIMKKTKRD